ncbi:MAG: ATP phosphoribosyltransferase regulatory subunit [Rhodospirillales bacterium]|nr:ATP phosphoribosyltransferase regulatory subunit [Rhodospirillales bacterium]
MTDAAARALLPAGLRDILPPDAAIEAGAVSKLMGVFESHGYQRVKPPLIEFEESLLGGGGAAMGPHSFRLMDPVSRRMLALRPDMTLQIARIAATRLGHEPRPLRLGYAGQVLRVAGSQLRPERQFGQAGIELIGSDSAQADAEAVRIAAEGLAALGLTGVSVDLTLPTLVPAVTAALGLADAKAQAVRDALDHKDEARLKGLPGAETFRALIKAGGAADAALAKLAAIDLPPLAKVELERLQAVVAAIRAPAPDLELTVDAVENRGFEYHSGVTFTLFAKGASFELGRGGRYRAGDGNGGPGEPAVGVTLFMDTILRIAPAPPAARRIYLAPGTDPAKAGLLRAEGWVTVAALDGADPQDQAKRLGCGHLLINGSIHSL